MISLPDDLPDDPVLLKQLLLEALNRQDETAQAYQTHIVDLKEQIKLLRDRLFGRKSEQTGEPNTPQRALSQLSYFSLPHITQGLYKSMSYC